LRFADAARTMDIGRATGDPKSGAVRADLRFVNQA